ASGPEVAVVASGEVAVQLELRSHQRHPGSVVVERWPLNYRRGRVAVDRKAGPRGSHVRRKLLLVGTERHLEGCVRLFEQIWEFGTVCGDGDRCVPRRRGVVGGLVGEGREPRGPPTVEFQGAAR